MLIEGNISYGHRTYGKLIPRGAMNKVKVGKFCSIAHGTIVDCGFNHRTDVVTTYPLHTVFPEIVSNVEVPKDIIIGNDVWLGEECLILDGAHVSDGAVLGARSLVKRNQYIGPYEIWAGAPARFIRHRFSYLDLNKHDTHSRNVARRLLKLKWWDFPEAEIRKIAPLLMNNDFETLFKLYNII